MVIKRNEIPYWISTSWGVLYPFWTWYTRDWLHKKPDLRETGYGNRGEKSICLELEIPDNEVLLSDYDNWHYVLNDIYYGNAMNEEEYGRERSWFETLPSDEQTYRKIKSWNKVFDIDRFESDWHLRGRYIQATFWALKLEHVTNVRFFIAR